MPRFKFTKTVENGITLYQWDVFVYWRQWRVMPGFSLAVKRSG